MWQGVRNIGGAVFERQPSGQIAVWMPCGRVKAYGGAASRSMTLVGNYGTLYGAKQAARRFKQKPGPKSRPWLALAA